MFWCGPLPACRPLGCRSSGTGVDPPPPPSVGAYLSRPEGSAAVTGVLAAYAYPSSCCGSVGSLIGSTLRNRPVVGSYSRAPRWTSDVLGSLVPPTNPFSPGIVAAVPRGSPNGVCRRTVATMSPACTDTVVVPWWSDASQVRPPAVVRTAWLP